MWAVSISQATPVQPVRRSERARSMGAGIAPAPAQMIGQAGAERRQRTRVGMRLPIAQLAGEPELPIRARIVAGTEQRVMRRVEGGRSGHAVGLAGAQGKPHVRAWKAPA